MPDLKVTSSHLERDAYLYIRQSTFRQVLENIESTQGNMLWQIAQWRRVGPATRFT